MNTYAKTTIGGFQIRNLKKSIDGSSCNCRLAELQYIGEIFVNDQWHLTKWFSDGRNASGIERWRIE